MFQVNAIPTVAAELRLYHLYTLFTQANVLT